MAITIHLSFRIGKNNEGPDWRTERYEKDTGSFVIVGCNNRATASLQYNLMVSNNQLFYSGSHNRVITGSDFHPAR